MNAIATCNNDPALNEFDRHSMWRSALPGTATAIVVSGDDFGRLILLRNLESSHDQLVGECDEAITAGCEVSIGFQAVGHTARRGMISAVQPLDSGCRLAITLHHRLAA